MAANKLDMLEMQEIISKLREEGFANIVDCLLENEGDCYTKKGRLNKSATIRKLGCKGKQLEDALFAMQELLKTEFDSGSEEDDEEE